MVLHPSPAIDRAHLHIAYFLAEFGTRPGQALGSLGHLFRYYLPLISSDGFHRQHKWTLPSPTTPAVFAVDALAHCLFGTANADSLSVRRSFDLYGLAIQSMSARMTEMKRAGSDFYHLSDEDWQHFAFFCLVMAFWEVCSPSSINPWPLGTHPSHPSHPSVIEPSNIPFIQKMKMSPASRTLIVRSYPRRSDAFFP
jgi:hypothetical protein